MMISTLPRFSTLAAAACFAAMLTSCETTGGGGGHVSSTDPRVIQAKKALLDSLGDMAVNNQWVEADRSTYTGGSINELNARLGAPNKPLISSQIATDKVHYSGWHLGDDNFLRGHYSSHPTSTVIKTEPSSGEIEIPVLMTDRIFIHDRQVNPEWAKASEKETEKMMGSLMGKATHQKLFENVNHTATVEFEYNRGKSADRIYFPSRQRAEQFVDRWHQLVAVLRQ